MVPVGVETTIKSHLVSLSRTKENFPANRQSDWISGSKFNQNRVLRWRTRSNGSEWKILRVIYSRSFISRVYESATRGLLIANESSYFHVLTIYSCTEGQNRINVANSVTHGLFFITRDLIYCSIIQRDPYIDSLFFYCSYTHLIRERKLPPFVQFLLCEW